jgi:iron complex transport system permease protein
MHPMNNALPASAGPPFRLALCLALAGTVALTLAAFAWGRFPVAVSELVAVLWAKLTGGTHEVSGATEVVILKIRGPRVVAALAVGAALAAAGAAFQNLFRNPLVAPDILGVSSGAALGAVLAIFLSLPLPAIQGFAFAGGLLAVFLVVTIGHAVRGRDPVLALVLTGVAVGTLLGSGIALLKVLADPYNQLPAMTFWLLGSFTAITPADLALALPSILLGALPLALLRWRIDILTLPEDEAHALGVPVARLRLAVVAGATLMTAAAVAIAGIIGWVGLLIPHAARLLVGPAFARLLPMAMLMGAAFMLLVDMLARNLATLEVPPGVLTAFIGTPLFLALLARGQSRR